MYRPGSCGDKPDGKGCKLNLEDCDCDLHWFALLVTKGCEVERLALNFSSYVAVSVDVKCKDAVANHARNGGVAATLNNIIVIARAGCRHCPSSGFLEPKAA